MSDPQNMQAFLLNCTLGEKRLLDNASYTCSQRKSRLTILRQIILLIIARATDGIKAYDILEVIRKIMPNAAPSTVYRPLNFLLEMNLISKVNTCQTFKVLSGPLHTRAETILVCPNCNKQTPLADKQLLTYLEDIVMKNGFAPHSKMIEIVTLCNECV